VFLVYIKFIGKDNLVKNGKEENTKARGPQKGGPPTKTQIKNYNEST
jgi:hypothetical protein